MSHARNWRARQFAAMAGPRECPHPITHRRETILQAMAVPGAQFAWLRGAESRQPQEDHTAKISAPLIGLHGGAGACAERCHLAAILRIPGHVNNYSGACE